MAAITKTGPVGILDDEQNREQFLLALEATRGNIAMACRSCGMYAKQIDRHMRLNPTFAEQVDAIQANARRRVSANLHSLAQDHLLSHLQESWIPVVDDNGDAVLDADFEQRKLSSLSVKSITDAMKETRQAVEGQAPLVALQVNSNSDSGAAPTFVMADTRDVDELMRLYGVAEDADSDLVDAEFEVLE